MKTTLVSAGIAIAMLCGCASFSSRQEEIALDGTKRVTIVHTRTLFDAKSELAKLRGSTTDKSQTLSIGSLDQSSSGTNIVGSLGLLLQIVREIKTPLPSLPPAH